MIERSAMLRAAAAAAIGGWVGVPPVVLALRVVLGEVTAAHAIELAAFLVAPWAVVLVNLVLFRAILGPARRTRRPR